MARYENKDAAVVIGISMGRGPDSEPIFDIVYFNIPDLTPEMIEKIESAKQEPGCFKDTVISHSIDMR